MKIVSILNSFIGECRCTGIDEIMVADFYADQKTRLKGHTLFAQIMQEL